MLQVEYLYLLDYFLFLWFRFYSLMFERSVVVEFWIVVTAEPVAFELQVPQLIEYF